MRYMFGAKIWHIVYGHGKHKLLPGVAYVAKCGAALKPGPRQLRDPKTPPANVCKLCSTLTAEQQTQLRKMRGQAKATPIAS